MHRSTGIRRLEGQVIDAKASTRDSSLASSSTESKGLSALFQFALPGSDNSRIKADPPRVREAAYPIPICKGISIAPRKCVRKRICVIYQSLDLNSVESIQARAYPPQKQKEFVRYLLIRAHGLTVLPILVARHISNGTSDASENTLHISPREFRHQRSRSKRAHLLARN